MKVGKLKTGKGKSSVNANWHLCNGELEINIQPLLTVHRTMGSKELGASFETTLY